MHLPAWASPNPYSRVGAPLGRGFRTGVMGETTDGQAAAGPRAPDEDPDSTAGPPSSRACSAATPPRTRTRATARTDRGDSRAARPAGQPPQAAQHARRRRLRAARRTSSRCRRMPALAELVEVFKASTLSRLPVYAETLDQPLGLVHLKDLALSYGFGAPARRVRPAQPAPAAALRAALDADRGAAAEDAGGAHPHGAGHRRVRRRRRPRHHRGPARADRRRHRRRARRGREPSSGPRRRPASTSRRGGWTSRISRRPPACGWPTRSSPRRSIRSAAWSSAWPAGCRSRGEVVLHPDGHEFEVLDADARKIKRLRVRLQPARRRAAAGGGIGRRSGVIALPRRVAALAGVRRGWRSPPAAGAATALAQPPVSWPVVLFLALPVLLWLLDGAAGPRAAFAVGWVAGRGAFRRGAVLDRRSVPGRARGLRLDGALRARRHGRGAGAVLGAAVRAGAGVVAAGLARVLSCSRRSGRWRTSPAPTC